MKQKYGLPPAAEVLEQHAQTNQRLLLAMVADDLPSPATPHGSRLKSTATSDYGRSQSAESTPMPSAPDLPASTFLTSESLRAIPPGDLSHQTRTRKHGLSREKVEESTAKRVATSFRTPLHFISLRSLEVIDADGNSSPAQ